MLLDGTLADPEMNGNLSVFKPFKPMH